MLMIRGGGDDVRRCGCAASVGDAVDAVAPARALLVRADLADALQHLDLDALALLEAREEPANRVLLMPKSA